MDKSMRGRPMWQKPIREGKKKEKKDLRKVLGMKGNVEAKICVWEIFFLKLCLCVGMYRKKVRGSLKENKKNVQESLFNLLYFNTH